MRKFLGKTTPGGTGRYVVLILLLLPLGSVCQTYSYPDIPDSIVGDVERASYMAEHFWDNADLNDTLLLQQPKRALDLIFLLQLCSKTESQKTVIGKTVEKFMSDKGQLGKLLFWFNRYLHNTQSPMYDDELYLLFIETLMQANAFGTNTDDLSQIRDLLLRNRINHAAEDFGFADMDGNDWRLYDLTANRILLIFYNPDCSRCRKIISEIKEDSYTSGLQYSRMLKIVAMCPWGDYDDWKKTGCPDGWICGFDTDAIIAAKRLYDIQQLPSIYILDSEKRVVVKEANSYSAVKSVLANPSR